MDSTSRQKQQSYETARICCLPSRWGKKKTPKFLTEVSENTDLQVHTPSYEGLEISTLVCSFWDLQSPPVLDAY